jgi:hypothetical protein
MSGASSPLSSVIMAVVYGQLSLLVMVCLFVLQAGAFIEDWEYFVKMSENL